MATNKGKGHDVGGFPIRKGPNVKTVLQRKEGMDMNYDVFRFTLSLKFNHLSVTIISVNELGKLIILTYSVTLVTHLH